MSENQSSEGNNNERLASLHRKICVCTKFVTNFAFVSPSVDSWLDLGHIFYNFVPELRTTAVCWPECRLVQIGVLHQTLLCMSMYQNVSVGVAVIQQNKFDSCKGKGRGFHNRYNLRFNAFRRFLGPFDIWLGLPFETKRCLCLGSNSNRCAFHQLTHCSLAVRLMMMMVLKTCRVQICPYCNKLIVLSKKQQQKNEEKSLVHSQSKSNSLRTGGSSGFSDWKLVGL